MQEAFIQSANTLTSLYNQSCQSVNVAHQQGREEAFTEVLQWFMTQGDNGSYRHVSVNEFQSFINSKLDAQKR